MWHMLTRNYRALLQLLSFAGGGNSKEPTSILSVDWKFTTQLRESRSGELEIWRYRYLTAVAPHSDDILSEVEKLPPVVAVICLFNWGSFTATTLSSASNGAGHSVNSSLILSYSVGGTGVSITLQNNTAWHWLVEVW
jgi:hypothetical protein